MEVNALNPLDKSYQELLISILKNGEERETRAGMVKSLFGKQLNIDLKNGYPLLTTKKMYFKGIAHELLWFLQHPYNAHGSMNIKYLDDNNVHIWDDDAYRWFKNDVIKHLIELTEHGGRYCLVRVVSDDDFQHGCAAESWDEGAQLENTIAWMHNMTKEDFLRLVSQKIEIRTFEDTPWIYRFGDVGGIYGKQWRSYGDSGIDQISEIIETLKTNPSDRRMLCLAYNPSVLNEIALPPCHVMMQFYSRLLSPSERWDEYKRRFVDTNSSTDSRDYAKIYYKAASLWTTTEERHSMEHELDDMGIPKRGLSCMWTQRSVDCFLGLPFNIASYALLTHMMSNVVGMLPDKLIGSLGDCHIYMNHISAVQEQLKRKGCCKLPSLEMKRKVEDIDDFKFEDFEVKGYKPDGIIKAQLNVGQ